MLSAAHWRGAVADRLLHLTQKYETALPYALALAVGLGAGGGAVIFRHLISAFHRLFFEGLGGALTFMDDWRVIFIPAAGGLLVGPIIYFLAREAKGHGVPEVMLATETQGGRIRPRVTVVKALASAICLGSGGSAGREGPIVQIGSALGSTVGQTLRLSDEQIRLMVACGAAGGISATFNAPIAGVFFALEVILRRFNVRNFSVVVLSSVVADALAHAFLGDNPAFIVPAYALESSVEFPLYALLGVFAAFAGLLFILVLYKTEDFFDSLPIREYVRPVVGGLGLGALGLGFGELFGVGYDAMGDALAGQKVLTLLIALAGLKVLATSITIGSGGSGGVFAPSLFIGAMMGAAFGNVAHRLFPAVTGSEGAYALVGMAAVFAAAARAPITSILILFEMTRDYSIILPLMMAVVVATVVAQVINRDTIYTVKLRRRGIDIYERREEPLVHTMLVAQAMTRKFEVIQANTSVQKLVPLMGRNAQQALPVMDDDKRLVGIVTDADLESALEKDTTGLTAGDIATKSLVTAYPDQTLHEAIRRLGSQRLRQLPVVSRHDPTLLLGLLRRSDVINAYGQAARERRQAPAAAKGLGALGPYGTELVELDIDAESPLIGRHVREMNLPEDSIIISILRERSPIIPRGNIVFRPGDHLVVAALPSALQEVMESLKGRTP